MENREYEIAKMTLEEKRREAAITIAIKRAGITTPSLTQRILPYLGDLLIRLGTRLKERTYSRLTTEEAAAPSFLIML